VSACSRKALFLFFAFVWDIYLLNVFIFEFLLGVFFIEFGLLVTGAASAKTCLRGDVCVKHCSLVHMRWSGCTLSVLCQLFYACVCVYVQRIRGFLNDMRYINSRFTYLLYLLVCLFVCNSGGTDVMIAPRVSVSNL